MASVDIGAMQRMMSQMQAESYGMLKLQMSHSREMGKVNRASAIDKGANDTKKSIIQNFK